jgi:hypothetical protein
MRLHPTRVHKSMIIKLDSERTLVPLAYDDSHRLLLYKSSSNHAPFSMDDSIISSLRSSSESFRSGEDYLEWDDLDLDNLLRLVEISDSECSSEN